MHSFSGRPHDVRDTLAERQREHARAALASMDAPDDATLAQAAADALAAFRAAEDRVATLTAAEAERARLDAVAVEQAAEAERQREKDKLIRQRDHVLSQYAREEKKLAEDQAVLDEAELSQEIIADEIAELRQEYEKITMKVETYRERIDSTDDRMAALVDEFAELSEAIDNFPVTAAEVAAHAEATRRQQEAEQAERIAEMEAESDREMAERYGAELVEVEPATVRDHGNGWLLRGGMVVAVPRRDLDRLAEAAKAYADQQAGPVPARRPAQPWRSLQGPPHCYGRNHAIDAWARAANPIEIAFCLTAAREREDAEAVEILSGHAGSIITTRTASRRELEEFAE